MNITIKQLFICQKVINFLGNINIPLHIDAAQCFVKLSLEKIKWNKYSNNIIISLDFHKSQLVNYGSSYLISVNEEFWNDQITSKSLNLSVLNNLVGSRSITSLKTLIFLKTHTKNSIIEEMKNKNDILKMLPKILNSIPDLSFQLTSQDFLHKISLLIEYKGSYNKEFTIKLIKCLKNNFNIFVDPIILLNGELAIGGFCI